MLQSEKVWASADLFFMSLGVCVCVQGGQEGTYAPCVNLQVAVFCAEVSATRSTQATRSVSTLWMKKEEKMNSLSPPTTLQMKSVL